MTTEPMETSLSQSPHHDGREHSPETSVYLMERDEDESDNELELEGEEEEEEEEYEREEVDEDEDDFTKPDDVDEDTYTDDDNENENGRVESNPTTTTAMSSSTSNPTAPSNTLNDATAASAAVAATSTTASTATPTSSANPAPTANTASQSTPAPQPTPTPAKATPENKTYKIAIKRLMSDFKQMESDPPEGVSGAPLDPLAPFVWRCAVFGPSDTTWEGGVFQLQMQFGADYPQKPPNVRFISKMFHPNVFPDGNLCLDIIQDKWSPVYSVSSILTSIQSLLSDPNPASPANPEAARLFASKIDSEKKEYRKRVRACVEKSTEGI